MAEVIRLVDIVKSYIMGDSIVHALDHVNVSIGDGEFTSIMGPSGSGKSTLLQILSCELKPTRGAVYLDHINVTAMSKRRQQQKRMLFGYVPQISALVRKKTIGQNLMSIAALRSVRSREATERIQKALRLVGMGDVTNRFPVELSLGEIRRVELARAILNNPEVLVLDELTANLDEDTAWDLFLFLEEVNRLGTTVIMATHAKKFVNLMRRRVITLVDGRIFGDVQRGRYGDVV